MIHVFSVDRVHLINFINEVKERERRLVAASESVRDMAMILQYSRVTASEEAECSEGTIDQVSPPAKKERETNERSGSECGYGEIVSSSGRR